MIRGQLIIIIFQHCSPDHGIHPQGKVYMLYGSARRNVAGMAFHVLHVRTHDINTGNILKTINHSYDGPMFCSCHRDPLLFHGKMFFYPFTDSTIIKVLGEFHDQGDAKWIVIRRQLRGHNDTPCGQPAPGRPAYWTPAGRIWWFRLLLISNNIFVSQHIVFGSL
jgi:hypothetical protein